MGELHDWFDEYSLSHQNPINITLHKVCVPVIVFSLVGMLWSIPIPKNFRNRISIGRVGLINASLILIPVFAFYWHLSSQMAICMLIIILMMLTIFAQMEIKQIRIFRLSIILFIIGWIGQFIGHEIEGKKPAFFKDLQFLFIGPLWVLASVFRLVGIDY